MSLIFAIVGAVMMLFGFFLAGAVDYAITLFIGGLGVAIFGAIIANRKNES